MATLNTIQLQILLGVHRHDTIREMAASVNRSPSYVQRLLCKLEEELYVEKMGERRHRGRVVTKTGLSELHRANLLHNGNSPA